jgi:hypothetical protein
MVRNVEDWMDREWEYDEQQEVSYASSLNEEAYGQSNEAYEQCQGPWY